MTPQEIYDSTLAKVILSFSDSSIFKKQNLAGKNWGLSICATPIQIGKGIILGINWGGGNSKDENFKIQQEMPSKESFLKDYIQGSYAFLKKSQKLIQEFVRAHIEKVEFNYTNLCFFRSPASKDLEYKDYEICLPIFKMLVIDINPPWILSLGNSNMNILKPLIKDLKRVKTIGSIHLAYFGKLWEHDFYCVPHPNARRLSNAIRYEIWKNVFSCKLQK